MIVDKNLYPIDWSMRIDLSFMWLTTYYNWTTLCLFLLRYKWINLIKKIISTIAEIGNEEKTYENYILMVLWTLSLSYKMFFVDVVQQFNITPTQRKQKIHTFLHTTNSMTRQVQLSVHGFFFILFVVEKSRSIICQFPFEIVLHYVDDHFSFNFWRSQYVCLFFFPILVHTRTLFQSFALFL